MTTLRRRVIRPVSTPVPHARRVLKLRTRLENEQRLLANWLVRLKRSIHGFDKYQRRVSWLEREIRTLETPHAAHD
jgi:hypothetical protein